MLQYWSGTPFTKGLRPLVKHLFSPRPSMGHTKILQFLPLRPPRSHNQNLLLCWVGWVYLCRILCCMWETVFGVTHRGLTREVDAGQLLSQDKVSYPRHIKYYRLLSAICGPSAAVMHDRGRSINFHSHSYVTAPRQPDSQRSPVEKSYK